MASCFALGFGVLHWITSISGILWFVALLVFSLWIPLHKISYLYPQWLSCKFVGLLEGSLNIQSAIYFYPTATEQILIEDRDNFCEVHGPKFLLSFADQNHSLSNSICLNVLFVELCCKCQSFPREVPLLENRALWRNEDFSRSALVLIDAAAPGVCSEPGEDLGVHLLRKQSNAGEDCPVNSTSSVSKIWSQKLNLAVRRCKRCLFPHWVSLRP